MLFSDAAWNSSTLAGGLSWVCQDSIGTHLFQGTENRRYIASALVAEALALRTGLSKAVSSGIKDVICFSDSKSLIDLITGNKSVISLRGILHDLGVLSESFSYLSYRYVPRNRNEQADKLTKHSLFKMSNNLLEIENSCF